MLTARAVLVGACGGGRGGRLARTLESLSACCSWNFDVCSFRSWSGWIAGDVGRPPHLGLSSTHTAGAAAGCLDSHSRAPHQLKFGVNGRLDLYMPLRVAHVCSFELWGYNPERKLYWEVNVCSVRHHLERNAPRGVSAPAAAARLSDQRMHRSPGGRT